MAIVKKQWSTEVGGKTLTLEVSSLAEQANAAILAKYGDTVILVTAVMGPSETALDYLPLKVDYEERFYAAGAILGSRYLRREGRPSDNAILSGRIVDRTIRPLFPQHIRNEVQVVITVLALNDEDADQVAVNAASLALATSDIPWQGPVAAVRIGQKDGATIINPSYIERAGAELDVLSCGKDGTINMIEVGATQVDEETVASAFGLSVEEHNKLLAWQKKIIAEIGKPKRDAQKPELPAALKEIWENEFKSKIKDTVFCGVAGKDAIHHLQDEWMAKIGEENPGIARRFFEDRVDEEIHRGAIEDNKRADNRRMSEVRPLFAKAGGVSTILHGSGIFYRGGTHVFTALTLGGPGDSQIIDSIEELDAKKRFMHHYNFPPYSSGETGRMGGVNRRATGHGALAEKAIQPVIPDAVKFPYTIRLVSECFASNGSTSMGSA